MLAGTQVESMPAPSQGSAEERKPKCVGRIASAMKHAAETLYRAASNMMHGTSVNDFGPQAAKARGFMGHTSSAHTAKRSTKRTTDPGVNELFPEQISVGRNPRRSSWRKSKRTSTARRHSLAYYIEREQRKQGRPLTPEEHQSVMDYFQHSNRLLDFGLEYVGSDEDN